jgi:hypothetical protein
LSFSLAQVTKLRHGAQRLAMQRCFYPLKLLNKSNDA